MGRVDERVSAQFAAWEQRGRGWKVWPAPVLPEPAFQEFTGYHLAPAQPPVDDGQRPGFLASFFDSVQKSLQPQPPVIIEETVEPEPVGSEEPLTVEFVASLPGKFEIREEALRAFVDSLEASTEPTGFELFATAQGVSIQFASSEMDAPILRRKLAAFFPELSFTQTGQGLVNAWERERGVGFIVDFGLAHELMLPLQTNHGVDPFVGLVAALGELRDGETAAFQVLFQPVQNNWAASVWRSVTTGDGKALFVNRPHLITGTKAKVEAPLFGVVVRTAAKARTFERANAIVRDMAMTLGAFEQIESNRLIPLTNDEYPFADHEEDLLNRQSRRSGMLLNREELLGFVHFPAAEVRSPKLERQRTKTRSAPETVLSSAGLLLGINKHAGHAAEVRLNTEQRVRHTHIIGASGTGKSTLLFNLIEQDINNGEGVAVLDPHGDLIDRILGVIPPERIDDVVLVDPSDEEYSIGFNILNAHSDLEKALLASDLVSVFQRLSSSWGDQMQSVLQNAILAILESSRGGTLADLRRFLIEPAYRSELLKSVGDPNVLYYWQKGFAHLSGNKSIGPVLTRLEMFLAKKPICHMVSQQQNRLDFAHIMDSGKIFLAKLPEGLLGKENSHLLGTLLISKFQQLAMSRQAKQISARRDFWIYMDEFQNFISPSMAEILSGARKYRIGLTLAHHELRQLQRESEVASAVLSHPCTRICFRVGDEDARKLGDGFSSFEARDLQNLGVGEAIARIERSDFDFNLFVFNSPKLDADQTAERRKEVIAASRRTYGTPRAKVEAILRQAWVTEEPVSKPSKRVTETVRPQIASVPAPEVKPAEVPKITVSRKDDVPPLVSKPVEAGPPVPNEVIPKPDEPPELRDLGRGGALHVTLQKRLQTEAQKLGFSAKIEGRIKKGSNQAADLILELGDFAIAVEVPVEGSLSDEFANVKKCLRAGFNRVAVVSLRPKLLQQLSEAVPAALGAEAAAKVNYYTPEEFLSELGKLAIATPAKPKLPSKPNTEIIGNYEVESEFPALTAEEQKQREESAIRLIAETMRKAKKK